MRLSGCELGVCHSLCGQLSHWPHGGAVGNRPVSLLGTTPPGILFFPPKRFWDCVGWFKIKEIPDYLCVYILYVNRLLWDNKIISVMYNNVLSHIKGKEGIKTKPFSTILRVCSSCVASCVCCCSIPVYLQSVCQSVRQSRLHGIPPLTSGKVNFSIWIWSRVSSSSSHRRIRSHSSGWCWLLSGVKELGSRTIRSESQSLLDRLLRVREQQQQRGAQTFGHGKEVNSGLVWSFSIGYYRVESGWRWVVSVSVFPPSCPSVKTQAQAVRPAAGAHLNTYGEPQECLRRLATKFFKQEKINKSWLCIWLLLL